MPFRNPVSSLPASRITGGNLPASVVARTLKTDVAPNKRWELTSSPANVQYGYSGSPSESHPGLIVVDEQLPDHTPYIAAQAGQVGAEAVASLFLVSANSAASAPSQLVHQAHVHDWNGDVTATLMQLQEGIGLTVLEGLVTPSLVNAATSENAFAAWTDYTPTTTNLAPTKTISGRYLRVGKRCRGWVAITLTSTNTTGATAIAVSLPFTSAAKNGPGGGVAKYRTNAGTNTSGVIEIGASSGSFTVLVPAPGGATPNLNRWANAAPAGQVSGDTWWFDFDYETA